ncbi:hypothetical protein NVP1259O_11 [Vibrio phage 1.259.O._10N.286.48.F4]|nr:hypothetical protein NVP1259O_11 [Vibrio phage 1.259.O._10N.286.48.F4]
MIEDRVSDSIAMLFDMPCVEFSGQQKNGGTVYLVYDEIKVINSEGEQSIDAICTLSIIGVRGRSGIGFISGVLMDFESKSDSVTIESLDKSESRDWVSDGTFELSKQVRITAKQDFDIVREQIKGINFKEG